MHDIDLSKPANELLFSSEDILSSSLHGGYLSTEKVQGVDDEEKMDDIVDEEDKLGEK